MYARINTLISCIVYLWLVEGVLDIAASFFYIEKQMEQLVKFNP